MSPQGRSGPHVPYCSPQGTAQAMAGGRSLVSGLPGSPGWPTSRFFDFHCEPAPRMLGQGGGGAGPSSNSIPQHPTPGRRWKRDGGSSGLEDPRPPGIRTDPVGPSSRPLLSLGRQPLCHSPGCGQLLLQRPPSPFQALRVLSPGAALPSLATWGFISP